MFEEFNNLDNQTPHPWTIGQEDLYDINFQVINELETNETNTFIDDKDEKIDSSFEFSIDSNYLGKKRKIKKIKTENMEDLKTYPAKIVIKN